MALLYRGPFLLTHAISQLTGRLMAEHMAGSGLSPNDFAIYSVIHAEGRITPSNLHKGNHGSRHGDAQSISQRRARHRTSDPAGAIG